MFFDKLNDGRYLRRREARVRRRNRPASGSNVAGLKDAVAALVGSRRWLLFNNEKVSNVNRCRRVATCY